MVQLRTDRKTGNAKKYSKRPKARVYMRNGVTGDLQRIRKHVIYWSTDRKRVMVYHQFWAKLLRFGRRDFIVDCLIPQS